MMLRRLRSGGGRGRRAFQSTAEYFEFVEAFIDRLRVEGHAEAAADLLEGYRCLNGLTDGWGLFLDALEQVQSEMAPNLDSRDRADLETIRAASRKAVYRR